MPVELTPPEFVQFVGELLELPRQPLRPVQLDGFRVARKWLTIQLKGMSRPSRSRFVIAFKRLYPWRVFDSSPADARR
jgi:hypothetical protein